MDRSQAASEDKDPSGLREKPAASPEKESSAFWGRLIPEVKGQAWRRILAWLFLVLGCLLLPLSIMGAWVRGSIFQTDGFTSTMGPLASEPAIQRMVSDVLSARVIEALDLEQRLQETLPSQLEFVAAAVEDQVEVWVRAQTDAVLASNEFAAVWNKALLIVHTTLSNFIRGEGVVELGPDGVIQMDLSPVTVRIVDRLEQVGVSLPPDVRADLVDGKVALMQVTELDKVKGVLSLLDRLFIVLPILAFVLLAASVAVADRRQRALARLGAGMMISMAVFIAVLALARLGVVHLITQAGPSTDVGEALWGRLTVAMRGTAWGLFVFGFILLISPRLVRALRSERVSQATGLAAGAGWSTGRAVAWLAAHRTLVAVVLLVLAFLILAFWTGLGWVAVLTVSVVTVVLESLVFFVARAHDIGTEAASSEPEGPSGPNSKADDESSRS